MFNIGLKRKEEKMKEEIAISLLKNLLQIKYTGNPYKEEKRKVRKDKKVMAFIPVISNNGGNRIIPGK